MELFPRGFRRSACSRLFKGREGFCPEFDATNSVALFLGSQYYKPYGSLDSYAKYALYAQGMSMLHSVSTRVIDGTFDGGMSDWNWRVFYIIIQNLLTRRWMQVKAIAGS